MKKPYLSWRVLVNRIGMLSVGTTVLYAHAGTIVEPPDQVCKPFNGTLAISSDFPCDIPGGASNATLQKAAIFAWQEFIALNWPAKIAQGTAFKREVPDDALSFGDPKNTEPLVWHTYRSKVEIYPFLGPPPGYKDSDKDDYGYDSRPQYNYGSDAGIIGSANRVKSVEPPWINLDENSQIGLDQMFAGIAPAPSDSTDVGKKILFLAKGNRLEYKYIASQGWWGKKGVSWQNEVPFKATAEFISANLRDPRPYPDQEAQTHVSFPNNTVEIKAAWRKLGPGEDRSRYYRAKVRYYVNASNRSKSGKIEYKDEELALVGLHIIHKTESAPYFIYATFEQADNILDMHGQPVENVFGEQIGSLGYSPLAPEILSNNSRGFGPQTFNIRGRYYEDPGSQLYYQNTLNVGLPAKGYKSDGSGVESVSNILVDRRMNRIPKEIINVNKSANKLIVEYADNKFDTPWKYYKLVNVQYKPIDKSGAGYDYKGGDDSNGTGVSTYYQSNSVIETDYNLQKFSGQFYGNFDDLSNKFRLTITDFKEEGKAQDVPVEFKNVVHSGSLSNMGGCMGCHGNAQHKGAGFSFMLLRGPVDQPDVANGAIGKKELARLARYFSTPSK